MTDVLDPTSTRPYLIRALYEWCTDNGLTPYVAVSVNERVQVPREYVKDNEIVLNISFDATTSLKLGNDFIEFKARFAGTAREIMVPVSQVIAIYARENGQGMAFPMTGPQVDNLIESTTTLASVPDSASVVAAEGKAVPLTSVDTELRNGKSTDEPDPPRPSTTGLRPTLKRVK